MARINGGRLGYKSYYNGRVVSGVWSIRDSQIENGIVVDFLIAGGGGAGGSYTGGGSGGLIIGSRQIPVRTQFAIVVGAGGTSVASSLTAQGGDGSESTLFGLTALGGGGGSGGITNGRDGGSGGGGPPPRATYDPGVSTQTLGFGNAGGEGAINGPVAGNATPAYGGGGGGAGAVGTAGTNLWSQSTGGIGIQSDITGANVYYCGGGGGAWQSGSETGFQNVYSSGGLGGGGTGNGRSGGTTRGTTTPGTANTGGGGGGARNTSAGAGNGGSGVVIIRSQQPASSITGTVIQTSFESYIVYQFNSTGTITF